MPKISLVIFLCLALMCCSEEMNVDSANERLDLSRKNLPDSCTTDLECPRGTTCDLPPDCFRSTGCGLVWSESISKDTACYYGHEDLNPCRFGGTYSAKECDEDIECPGASLCIRRVCQYEDRCNEKSCEPCA